VNPADVATIYDTPNSALNPSYSGPSYDGTGVNIGIAGDSNITEQDVALYRYAFLPASYSTLSDHLNVIVDGNDPYINGAAIEALLDLEVSGGIAPGAKTTLYAAANTDMQSGLFLAIYRALDDNAVGILNVSFGQCEAFIGTSGNQQILNAWEQAAAQGISVTVSTGDSGSAGCDGDTATIAKDGLQVNGLASTPYNIAVAAQTLMY
jgi:subtilase family serine protease